MGSILTNDHFLLGVGLTVGPAIIVCFVLYQLFKRRLQQRFSQLPGTLDSLLSMEGAGDAHGCPVHSGLVRDTAFAIEECKSIWLEIKEINKRQMSLRERLPREYVSRDDLHGIQERLNGIDQKLDRYYELGVRNLREKK